MSRKLFWPIMIILSALLAGILVWSDGGGAFRSIILFWFILICPGMAFVRLLQIENVLTEIVLAIALSLVISTLLAEFMVLTHLWSPGVELAILIGISLLGAALQIKKAYQVDIPTGQTI